MCTRVADLQTTTNRLPNGAMEIVAQARCEHGRVIGEARCTSAPHLVAEGEEGAVWSAHALARLFLEEAAAKRARRAWEAPARLQQLDEVAPTPLDLLS
jgi:hypothetical protein